MLQLKRLLERRQKDGSTAKHGTVFYQINFEFHQVKMDQMKSVSDHTWSGENFLKVLPIRPQQVPSAFWTEKSYLKCKNKIICHNRDQLTLLFKGHHFSASNLNCAFLLKHAMIMSSITFFGINVHRRFCLHSLNSNFFKRKCQ